MVKYWHWSRCDHKWFGVNFSGWVRLFSVKDKGINNAQYHMLLINNHFFLWLKLDSYYLNTDPAIFSENSLTIMSSNMFTYFYCETRNFLGKNWWLYLAKIRNWKGTSDRDSHNSEIVEHTVNCGQRASKLHLVNAGVTKNMLKRNVSKAGV